MSDTFVYTTPLDPRAKPLIDELTYEYDSRYGSYFNAAGAVEEDEPLSCRSLCAAAWKFSAVAAW